jgi:hypothetical protein
MQIRWFLIVEGIPPLFYLVMMQPHYQLEKKVMNEDIV